MTASTLGHGFESGGYLSIFDCVSFFLARPGSGVGVNLSQVVHALHIICIYTLFQVCEEHNVVQWLTSQLEMVKLMVRVLMIQLCIL